MNVLAIDTSSHNLSLSILLKGSVVASSNRQVTYGSSRLVSAIERLLKARRVRLSQFDAFVIGAGPGSFTGLRISFAVVKAFGLSLKKPVVAVESFYSCAKQAQGVALERAVIGDARRGLIYGARYRVKGEVVQLQGKIRLYQLDDFVSQNNDRLFVTYDSGLRTQVCARYPGVAFHERDVYPRAQDLFAPAQVMFRQKNVCNLSTLEPLYIHPKTCQIRRKT